VVGAWVGLFVLAPLMVGISILVLITMGRPVIFRQLRPGLRGNPFTIFKFRTMKSHSEKVVLILTDGERLTAIGRILRATSLDELPELWNVLKGEMSLVGPRPLLMEYLNRYTPQQARRMEVKPGITGWAQVNGRNALSWDEKFKLDVWYVNHHSFWLDMKIMGMTIFQVLARKGITAKGCATMPEFFGSEAIHAEGQHQGARVVEKVESRGRENG
jgi:sugar transferase EpsL